MSGISDRRVRFVLWVRKLLGRGKKTRYTSAQRAWFLGEVERIDREVQEDADYFKTLKELDRDFIFDKGKSKG